MLSLNDIINASFRKSGFSGYRTDDVDQFIDTVKESYDEMIKNGIEQKEKYERLKKENGQLTEKLKILAAKVEEYRAEEDEIKNALVSAQKLSDASVREARHKAEIILKDAGLKAERIVSGAKQDVVNQQSEFEKLKQAVSDFRSRLLSMYKEHLTLIDALPSHRTEQKEVPAHAPAEGPAEEPEVLSEPEKAAEPPLFHSEISNFDDAQPAAHSSHASDISDDPDSPDGILHANE